jgi:uncharacterized protein
LRFADFQSIEILWDSSTGYERSASDAWLICDAKKHRCELLQCGRRCPSNSHRKTPQDQSDHFLLASRFSEVLFSVSMKSQLRYLIVDGHSIIFAWPELRKLHARRSSLAREALLKRLRDYQDWTGVRVVAVFDGKGKKVDVISDPTEVQVFYSRRGQSADSIIERLASKYAKGCALTVATSDLMEAETVHACGAESISPEGLRGLLASARGT